MKNLFPAFIFSLITFGCSAVTNQGMQSRTVEDYYNPTGVEKYFLTDIPHWANFDQKASCFRTENIRYFDINALMKSYGLTYSKALQVQGLFNEEYSLFKQSEGNHKSTLKQEELLFYKVSEKVSNKILFFDPPIYKRINLVMLDEVVGDAEKESKLNNFLKSKIMDEGVPVLISFCLTRAEVEKRFPDLNSKMITAELFSVFDHSGVLTPRFQIELNQLFLPGQKLYFYSQKKVLIDNELKGLYKINNY
jgi:hypothetical protein